MSEPDASDPSPAESTAKPTPSPFIRNTLMRLGTAAVGIPILLYLMFIGPEWAYQGVVLLCIARAAHELMRMTMQGERVLYLWGVASTLGLATTLILAHDVAALTSVILVVAASGTIVSLSQPQPLQAAGVRLAWLIAGPLYVGGLLSSLGRLHLANHGGQWVLLAMWIAWASDTGAYFAGRFFGKHKLAPRVSPSKTIEGAIGGVLGSLTGALAAHFWFLPSLPLLHAIGLTVIANVLGQCGDLVESLVKRSTGVKDSGSILPGHGGMLDRVDALMFTSTACLLYTLWIAS
jgi:phosphatidate cytidylyltransferase